MCLLECVDMLMCVSVLNTQCTLCQVWGETPLFRCGEHFTHTINMFIYFKTHFLTHSVRVCVFKHFIETHRGTQYLIWTVDILLNTLLCTYTVCFYVCVCFKHTMYTVLGVWGNTLVQVWYVWGTLYTITVFKSV